MSVTKRGPVRRHLNVFVNSDNVRDLDGVDTALAGGRGHDPARGLRRLKMADRVILTIGTKKGVFVAEAAKPGGASRCAGPSGPASPCTRR